MPRVKIKTVAGSKTKAMPKPRKYKRKKSAEVIPPVEKMKRRITVFKRKTPRLLSKIGFDKLNPFLEPFFFAEIRRKRKIKKPNIWIVYWERGVFCQIKTNKKERITKNDCKITFIYLIIGNQW